MRARALSRFIGAAVEDVDLAATSPEQTTEIRSLLLQHKVLFFPKQALTAEQHLNFAAMFGVIAPASPLTAATTAHDNAIYRVDNNRYQRLFGSKGESRTLSRNSTWLSGWHTDVSAALNPPSICILRAEFVPEGMGDTIWSSLEAAYDGLSEPLRALADRLWAEHHYGAGLRDVAIEDRFMNEERALALVSHHPVVRVHPETKRRALFVNPSFTDALLDVHPAEGRVLLELFFGQIARPANCVRYQWSPGDVAIWDNRCTAHLAAEDLAGLDVRRVLHRIALVGDVPVGINGQESRPLAGNRFEY